MISAQGRQQSATWGYSSASVKQMGRNLYSSSLMQRRICLMVTCNVCFASSEDLGMCEAVMLCHPHHLLMWGAINQGRIPSMVAGCWMMFQKYLLADWQSTNAQETTEWQWLILIPRSCLGRASFVLGLPSSMATILQNPLSQTEVQAQGDFSLPEEEPGLTKVAHCLF
jgi:hypothetical protein